MSRTARNALLLMIGSSLVLALSLGVRHAFGLFLQPMSNEFGWGREIFAFAIALQNLIWGVLQPFVGAFADRYGVKRTVFISAFAYTLGLLLMASANTPSTLFLSAGVLIGFGLSGTSFSVLLSAVGRSVAPEKRSMAMGIASAAGSFGQFVMLPGTLGLLEVFGWSTALLVCAGLIALLLPLSRMLKENLNSSTEHTDKLPVKTVLRQVAGHGDFWLLSLGFFVCGFQVVFIGIHIPAYLIDQQLPAQAGTMVLALVGLFNIAGTWCAGWLGGRYAKPQLLAMLYFLRAIVIALFFYLPLSEFSAYAFAVAMGLLWLSTVPLTNGTIATMFGVRHLSMLAGIVFLFHQVGSFLGGWLGGLAYDQTGSYSLVWQLSIVLSIMAALLNLPIRERLVSFTSPAKNI
jgi:predicted MFS family arabinose efflux permease